MTWLRALWVAALLLVLALAADDAPLRIVVESGSIQWEPATVRLRVRVEPDKANRALAVGIVGSDWESSSLEQLEGDSAPITRWKLFKDIPAGEYQARAEVYRPGQESWYALERLTVLPRAAEW